MLFLLKIHLYFQVRQYQIIDFFSLKEAATKNVTSVGDRLSQFSKVWTNLVQNKWAVSTITKRFLVEFDLIPISNDIRNFAILQEDQQILDQKVQLLLKK
jgi:hypothetical protein